MNVNVKICFICSEYPPGPHGGIGTMTQVLGRALAEAGHEVRSMGVYPQNYPAPEHENDGSVRIQRLRDSGQTFYWAWMRMQLFKEVARQARQGAIDVVEVPDYQGWAAGWRSLPIPVVVRLHGSESYFAGELGREVSRLTYRLERASLRRSDFWTSVCRYTADKTRDLFHLESEPSAILYNPIEVPELPSNVSREGHRFIFSGTLTPKKGVISLVEAWTKVAMVRPDAELHIYGKDGRTDAGGSMRDYLKNKLGSARASVQFHGHVTRDELFKAFVQARGAVFPSYAEAFAVAPLESMASGCPTIYSRRGSGPELLTDGKQGLLVDPDRPDGIAAAILRLLNDDGLADRLGRAGRGHVIEKFSTPNLVKQNVEFYASSIERFHALRPVACAG